VEAILADVYLTYAGAPVKGGDQYYAESAKRSKAVIDNGGYSLFTNYTDMINPGNKNKGGIHITGSICRCGQRHQSSGATYHSNYSGISKYADELRFRMAYR